MKAAISACVILVALAGAGRAEPVCMPSDAMEAALTDWYQMAPRPGGADRQSALWEAPGGQWARISYRADGRSCVLAKGGPSPAAPRARRPGAPVVAPAGAGSIRLR